MTENKLLLKHIFISMLLVNGYIRFKEIGYSYRSISDACALVGVTYLIVGLFRLVNRMGFFNSLKYGTKKLFEIIITKDYSKKKSKLGEYVDYLRKTTYEKTYSTFLVVSGILIISSIGLAII